MAQHVWPCLAPFLDPRSVKTATSVLGPTGVNARQLWETEEVGKSPERMCRLAAALTRVRLDGLEVEFED